MSKQHFVLLFFLLISTAVSAQQKKAGSAVHPPAMNSIREQDLRTDLYELAGDHFRGREAGTLDELKASVWWANKMKAAGLQPAGDDSTYFQFFSMKRHRIGNSSTVSIGGQSLLLWQDVLVAQIAPAVVAAPIVYVGDGSPSALDSLDLKGKAVAIRVSKEGIDLNVSLPERRYPGYVFRKYGQPLLDRGAAAIIFIADEQGEQSWSQVVPMYSRGLYDIEGGANASITVKAPVLWLHTNALETYHLNGAVLNARIDIESFEYPSVNIIGKIEGTDPELKSEYVLYSGHTDHDGVRQPFGTDSIYNGADDNASVDVALLAIARAFKMKPGRRSTLFVWHGAEERGLLGSKWYATHPTVEKNSDSSRPEWRYDRL